MCSAAPGSGARWNSPPSPSKSPFTTSKAVRRPPTSALNVRSPPSAAPLRR